MRIWTLGEILKTEHLGHERYVRDEECREALQEKILEILEQDKEIEQLRKALAVIDKVTWRDRMTKEALISDIVYIRNIARQAQKEE